MKLKKILEDLQKQIFTSYAFPVPFNEMNVKIVEHCKKVLLEKYGCFAEEEINDCFEDNGSIALLPILELNPGQRWVIEGQLDKKRKQKNPKSKNDHPQIFLFGGKYYIQDGHHRIAIAYERGDIEIEVKLIAIDDGT